VDVKEIIEVANSREAERQAIIRGVVASL
jgi:hypothetical protein